MGVVQYREKLMPKWGSATTKIGAGNGLRSDFSDLGKFVEGPKFRRFGDRIKST